MDSNSTNLESNKPDALDDVADNQEVLHGSKRRDVHPNIEECNADQALILIECSYKNLGRNKISQGLGPAKLTTCLLSHRRH